MPFRPSARGRFAVFDRGHVAVSLVVVTGIANTTLVLGLFGSGLVLPLPGPARRQDRPRRCHDRDRLINRYFLVPQIRLARTRSLRLLSCLTVAELLLGSGVLVLVSLFGMIEPTSAGTPYRGCLAGELPSGAEAVEGGAGCRAGIQQAVLSLAGRLVGACCLPLLATSAFAHRQTSDGDGTRAGIPIPNSPLARWLS